MTWFHQAGQLYYGLATLFEHGHKSKTHQEPGLKRGGGNKNSGCDDGSPSHTISQRKHLAFFELSTGAIGSNHSMALTELFMSFNQVGQLYYGLANLLKVCALNLTIDTYNLRY